MLIHYLAHDDAPELYRYMVAHYFYEYIHPFYDGNGRTGRLLLGSYLSSYLERYSAVVFSYAVNRHRKKYYKALEGVSSHLNQGELTFYLIDMLEILVSGQQSLIEDLELNLAKMKHIDQFFADKQWQAKHTEREILQMMTVLYVFIDEDAAVSVTELIDLLGLTRYKLNQSLAWLEENNCIQLIRQRPKTYRVNENYMAHIFP